MFRFYLSLPLLPPQTTTGCTLASVVVSRAFPSLFRVCALRPLASPTCSVLFFPFVSPFARSKSLPSLGDDLSFGGKRKENLNRVLFIDDRWTNQLVETVFHQVLFGNGLGKVEIGDVFSSSMMIHWRERVNFFSSSHEIFPRTEIIEIERNWKNALIVNLSSSSMTTCLWSLYVLDVEHASKEVKGTELGETGMGSLQNDRKALRAFSRRIRGPLERFLERLGALRDRRNFVEARLWLVETCRHG